MNNNYISTNVMQNFPLSNLQMLMSNKKPYLLLKFNLLQYFSAWSSARCFDSMLDNFLYMFIKCVVACDNWKLTLWHSKWHLGQLQWHDILTWHAPFSKWQQLRDPAFFKAATLKQFTFQRIVSTRKNQFCFHVELHN